MDDGKGLFACKNYEEALICFNKCLKDNSDAYYYRGVTLLKLERREEAIDDFSEAIIRKDPNMGNGN